MRWKIGYTVSISPTSLNIIRATTAAAIARALVQNTDIILADEPVASLDPAAADRVMKTLEKINKEDGSTVLVSLHQIEYAIEYCSRVVALKDGKLIFDGKASRQILSSLQIVWTNR